MAEGDLPDEIPAESESLTYNQERGYCEENFPKIYIPKPEQIPKDLSDKISDLGISSEVLSESVYRAAEIARARGLREFTIKTHNLHRNIRVYIKAEGLDLEWD